MFYGLANHMNTYCIYILFNKSRGLKKHIFTINRFKPTIN